MGRFLFFLGVFGFCCLLMNFVFAFAIALVASILLDVYLVATGKMGSANNNKLQFKPFHHASDFNNEPKSFKASSHWPTNSPKISLNPASGLPIMDGSGIDIAGNPYGSDMQSIQKNDDIL